MTSLRDRQTNRKHIHLILQSIQGVKKVPLKLGEPFGLEKTMINAFDWHQATRRVSSDMRTDFIFAPHIRLIFDKNADGVIDRTTKLLGSGRFVPGSPMTIEVPKSSRIRVQSTPPRSGPNYSRPGSILMPQDRLFYQFIADNCVEIIENHTDEERSFSHRIDKDDPDRLFQATRECWSNFQQKMREFSEARRINYVLKVDIANYFGSINQHILVNNLSALGLARPLVERLEVLLTSFTNSRSSRGIIQGVFPSDLIGNFYLEPLDRYLGDLNYLSARYVDDIFVFVESVSDADDLMKSLIPFLRSLDLTLNESKSSLFPKIRLVVEEPDLEILFQDAIEEIREQLEENDFEVSYGFQSEWDEDEEEDSDEDEEAIELRATEALFDSIDEFKGHEEEIERFCLPLFLKAGSDYAVQHVLTSFRDRPSMCQIYCAYLGKFVSDQSVFDFLFDQLELPSLYDWQLMWIIGAMLQRRTCSDDAVRRVLRIFRDRNRHECVRAVAAIFVGRKGDRVRVDALANECPNESPYVQAAIYFSSRSWPSTAKKNFRAQWGNRNELNILITEAFDNL